MRERNNNILKSGSSDNLMFLSEESSDGHEKLEYVGKSKLNEALKYFFHEIRNKRGDKYPPETLRLIMSGLQRFLKLERSLDWKV